MIAEPIAGSPAQTTSQQPRIMIAALFVTLLFGHWYDLGRAAAAEDDWRTVQSYLREESAWRQNDKQGAHPEITRAVAAAKAIIATPDHPKTADAAMFLMAYLPGVSPTAEADVSVGEHALATHVGPDWSVVEGFGDAAMMQNMSEIVSADISDYEKMRQVDALSYRPIAAALAVLNAGWPPEDARGCGVPRQPVPHWSMPHPVRDPRGGDPTGPFPRVRQLDVDVVSDGLLRPGFERRCGGGEPVSMKPWPSTEPIPACGESHAISWHRD